MLNTNMIYKPLCYKLNKIMSVLKTVLSILLLFAVLNSITLKIAEKGVLIIAFLLYSLSAFVDGICLRYISKNVSLKEDTDWRNEWKERLNICDFTDVEKYFYIRDILLSFSSELVSYNKNELDKHIKDLKQSSSVSFVLSIIIFISLIIPLMV